MPMPAGRPALQADAGQQQLLRVPLLHNIASAAGLTWEPAPCRTGLSRCHS